MVAIIQTGGKQILVKKDMTIFIEKIPGEIGATVEFKEVLLAGDKVGQPFVTGAVVAAKIEKQGKQKKIIVYRHNAKSTHKRKYGHRQPYTRLKVIDIKA